MAHSVRASPCQLFALGECFRGAQPSKNALKKAQKDAEKAAKKAARKVEQQASATVSKVQYIVIYYYYN